MQKKIVIVCLWISMILSGCAAPTGTTAPSPIQTIAATDAAPAALTETLAPIATDTSAPVAATATLTPQPSRTPSAPQTCPQVDEKVRPQFGPVFKGKKEAYHDARQAVLDFLNRGGNPQTAIAKLAENNVSASQFDVTADGVPEFLLPSGYYSIFGCQNGKYQTLLDLAPTEYGSYEAVALVIDDLNQNGVTDILIAQVMAINNVTKGAKYSLLEWNGTKLIPITPVNYKGKNSYIYIENHEIYAIGKGEASQDMINGNWEVIDIDQDGLKEIAIKAGEDVTFFLDPFLASYNDLEEQIILKSNGAGYEVASYTVESTPTTPPTSTPLPFSEKCDYNTPNLKYQSTDDSEESVANFLNAGGEPTELNSNFNTTIKDLNSDGIPEITVISRGYFSSMFLFSCINGVYENSLDPSFEQVVSSIQILSTDDLNKNGLPEIATRTLTCFLNSCGNMFIAEWDGKQFSALIKDPKDAAVHFAEMSFYQDSYIKDLDNDGFAEIVWVGGKPNHEDFLSLPSRIETHVYKWDGKYYRPKLVEYSNPTYLFQAVQDGDHYALDGQLEKAFKMYNEVLKNETLSWWTESRQKFLLEQAGYHPCENTCPQPNPDADEKPILQAYASYRIMLAQILLDQQTEAENTYKNLIATYTKDSRDNYAGAVVADLATAFWNEYKASQNIKYACSEAIMYTERHTDFLQYIGGGYHGWQMDTYEPKDICPFKK